MEEKSKLKRCRYCHIGISKESKFEYHCCCGDNDEITTEKKCESCDNFNSKYIEYPIEVAKIDTDKIDTSGLFHETGCLVEIKPCAEEYGGKSYIGIYIGELPISITVSYNKKEKGLKVGTLGNPAIFVPDLKKIIYGCESYWREIKGVDDFKGITKEEIESQWYVKLLKDMSKGESS